MASSFACGTSGSDILLIEQLHKPELAFLPIGDHFTMSPREAALAARLLKARTIIPMHFGAFPLLTSTPDSLGSSCEIRPSCASGRWKSKKLRDGSGRSAIPGCISVGETSTVCALGGEWQDRRCKNGPLCNVATRIPLATVFENLEARLTVEEVMEEFSVTREQINAVIAFRGEELGNATPARCMQRPPMLILFDHGTPPKHRPMASGAHRCRSDCKRLG
jgi:uncharacterized protein (DUF433 family)